MPHFSAESLHHLESCHRDLRKIFEHVIRTFDCKVICGHRPQQAQDALYMEGKTQVKWPDSNHNTKPSMAADVVPYPIDWDDRDRFHLFGGYVLATAENLRRRGVITHRVRWGGDWDQDTQVKDNNFDDLPHFELVPL